MATFYFDSKYSSICNKLADEKVIKTGDKIFNTLMDLAVFSAIVAINKGPTAVEKNGSEIPDRIFINNNKEGLIYMIALMDTKDPYILKDDRLCWKIFQEYANTGMSEIAGWLTDNPTDITGVDTLLNVIADKASKLLDIEEGSKQIPDIEF
ncbi:hypothetical protein ACM93F_003604 [Enterobacter ludwigii]|uniref:hypothetical protein n=1 Tax=Enterobacter TaxID=547 RepID=UPI00091073A2|nr:hypothetical protein [Enterobacter ludwigii]ELP5695797.1 hypothetical protein [Enterobacter ludwigii]EMD2745587.1 hypothetical protein [Enterobacter ludwigii]EMD2747078.1 hypothetical protein [Enterobacter ludwigii]MDZ5702871.1 hypothetical protein [Enterobacter ludwigii]SHM73862.1 dnd system-associated protein 4 [Enterobacter ludwigii]